MSQAYKFLHFGFPCRLSLWNIEVGAPNDSFSCLQCQKWLPPADPRTDQEQGEQGTAGTLNANNLTMDQALELFELLQTRRTRETHQSSTVEAHHVEVAPVRSEPLW